VAFRARSNSPTEGDGERVNLHTADSVYLGHNGPPDAANQGPPKPLFKVTTGQKQEFGPFQALAAESTATNTECVSKLSVKRLK